MIPELGHIALIIAFCICAAHVEEKAKSRLMNERRILWLKGPSVRWKR